MEQKSFADILTEQIRKTAAKPLSTPQQDSIAKNYETPIFISFKNPHPKKWQFKPHTPKAYTPSKNINAILQKPILPEHVLNQEQKESFHFFMLKTQTFQLPDLSTAFTAEELKTTFRILALKLHPDQGGMAKDFILLRQHYLKLHLVLKNPT